MRVLRGTGFSLLACLMIGVIGCSDEASVEKETKITGPEGTTTINRETTIESTGENPPIAVDPD